MSGPERLRHRRPPQIQVAVTQSQILVHPLLIQRERWGFTRVQDLEFRGHHLHLARAQSGIFGPLRSGGHLPRDGHHKFRSQRVGHFRHLGMKGGIEYHLGDPLPIPQIDENHPAVVSPPGNPAGEPDFLAGIGGPERPAAVGTFHEPTTFAQSPTPGSREIA